MGQYFSKHKLADFMLAAFYFYPAQTNAASLFVDFKLSVLFLLVFNSSVVVIALMRRAPVCVTPSWFHQIIAFCGTLAPLLFLGKAGANDHWFFVLMQVFGICISYAGLLSLNKSFGIVPADRGIVTTGMYRFVRHPLYTGYVLLCLGFMLQNFTDRNLAAFIAFLIFESLRLLIEEDFLSQGKAYAAYKRQTKWRIIPYIW